MYLQVGLHCVDLYCCTRPRSYFEEEDARLFSVVCDETLRDSDTYDNPGNRTVNVNNVFSKQN